VRDAGLAVAGGADPKRGETAARLAAVGGDGRLPEREVRSVPNYRFPEAAVRALITEFANFANS